MQYVYRLPVFSNYCGKLEIECNSLILENGSGISVNNKGYKGGMKGGFQGYSYNGSPKQSMDPNFGGGGTNTGGGYGTVGHGFGKVKHGGSTYGNKRLMPVYLGSGGGGGSLHHGTNGGGAIIINCKNEIIVGVDASITANGGYRIGIDAKSHGCGSGGSIYLKSPSITNNGYIHALGGSWWNGGNGGFGRIRIDCKKDIIKQLNKTSILPSVGFFGEIN